MILTLSDPTLDARIHRQADFLAAEYSVVVAAIGPPLQRPGIEAFELRWPSKGRAPRLADAAARIGLRLASRYEHAYWAGEPMRRWRDELRRLGRFDAVVANDLWGVPLALAVADGAPVIFDAHEHWTSESASWSRRHRLSMRGAHDWIVDHDVPRTASMMTVSPGIAHDYEQRVGVQPALVTNAPYVSDLEPTPVGDPIRLLHVGLADPRRRLEDTIDAARMLGDRFSLDIVLARDNEYRRRLEQMVATDERIRILPAVANDELIAFENSYDVGVFLLPDRFPNQIHVLPNKLFDYIQARLAIAIGPSREMAAIVNEWDCGVVSDSFSVADFAAALDSLTPGAVARMKTNAHRAAAVLNAEHNREVVQQLVGGAIASTDQPLRA